MKLLSAEQIRQWDSYTIANEPVSAIDLMERAASRCTEWILEHYPGLKSVKICCGKGNNGGDGLAIARQLIIAGIKPEIFILEFGAKGTEDFQQNLSRLHELTNDIYFLQEEGFFPAFSDNDIIIDALFGSGLNRPLQDLAALLVKHINNTRATVISIDLPSGLYIDKSAAGNTIVEATHTLTFQSLKLCLLMAENAAYFGNVQVLNIGLADPFLQTIDTPYLLTSIKDIAGIYKPRKAFAHKGTYGHALLIAGNTGKMGAALMAAKACLRSGAGLLTVQVPETSFSTIHVSLPEAMCISREADLVEWSKYATVGIGPGLGTDSDSVALVKQVIESYNNPLLLDADALNIVSTHAGLLAKLPPQSILTPHPKEFDRLFGNHANDFERLETARQVSLEHPLVIVLKGHYTAIVFNGITHFNTTGNAGLAKGGSGDILTGIITALLAQKYNPADAAILGVFLHGLAADLSLDQQSMESVLPTDVIESLGHAWEVVKGEL
ncbi:MAG: NAD(P)H-hydrate dehydratase [Filimonas sp.]|nr:NAD(P)H-hydrate dehydratase [Filimonas sp.]